MGHFVGLFFSKALLILLTPVLLMAGTWLAWKLGLWMLKRFIRQIDIWLEQP